ncbi:MAG: V-type ATP synthase subunit E [Spirochaetes bacterium]|jgi:V/A-type H+-transporting ATPase subunit E|nr:V-type ATP synthase subunit E [Spirochaetota bacterium]
MDAQLNEIIETIKSEGVESAERQAAEIKKKAEEDADQTIKDAEKRAREIVEDARAEAQKLEQSGKQALTQAGRDLILNLRNRITTLFDTVVEKAAGEAYSADAVSEAVVALIKAWPEQRSSDLNVLLPESQRDKVESQLRSRLAEEIKAGLEIKPVQGIDAGFRISVKDGSVYYDFSSEGIAEVLSAYLNPRLQEAVKQGAEQAEG